MRTPPNSSGKKLSSSVSNLERLLRSTYSLNATCSDDASSDSFHSRVSTGRITRSNSTGRITDSFPNSHGLPFLAEAIF